MSDVVKVNWSLSIGLAGCQKTGTEEFDREEWEGMDDDQREDAMKEIVFQELEWGYDEEDPS